MIGHPRLWGVLALLAALCGTAGAVDQVSVQGLFQGMAVVRIDGTDRLLRAGQRSPEGVRLVSADSERAVLEVEGRTLTLGLGSDVSTALATPETSTARIPRDASGLYRTIGSINGQTVRFLVDTGATRVSLNAAEARRLGIDYRVVGVPAGVVTASGYEEAWRVRLDRVRVGGVELRGVEAVVLDGPLPAETLLGMSFLQRLELQDQGNMLVITQRH